MPLDHVNATLDVLGFEARLLGGSAACKLKWYSFLSVVTQLSVYPVRQAMLPIGHENVHAAYNLSVLCKATHRRRIMSQLARQDPNPWHHSHTHPHHADQVFAAQTTYRSVRSAFRTESSNSQNPRACS